VRIVAALLIAIASAGCSAFDGPIPPPASPMAFDSCEEGFAAWAAAADRVDTDNGSKADEVRRDHVALAAFDACSYQELLALHGARPVSTNLTWYLDRTCNRNGHLFGRTRVCSGSGAEGGLFGQPT
jgi:hypothetical protein